MLWNKLASHNEQPETLSLGRQRFLRARAVPRELGLTYHAGRELRVSQCLRCPCVEQYTDVVDWYLIRLALPHFAAPAWTHGHGARSKTWKSWLFVRISERAASTEKILEAVKLIQIRGARGASSPTPGAGQWARP